MRKVLLLFIASVLSGVAFGQISFQQLGSASNSFTALNPSCHTIATNQTLNTVVFIHRNSVRQYPNFFTGNYRYDFSGDLGNTFTLDFGPINPQNKPTNPIANNGSRYPQGIIYNPASNTNLSNAYLLFAGSWHNGAASSVWEGIDKGSVNLSNTATTWSDSLISIIDSLNTGFSPATSLVEGAPGVYWTIAQDGKTNSGAGTGSSILVMKGVYNSTTHEVVWALNNTITHPFDEHNIAGTNNVATDLVGNWNIAFDNTGMNGWINAVGDITRTFNSNSEYVASPIFYHTTNGGKTWSGPMTFQFADIKMIGDSLLGLPRAAGIGDSIYAANAITESDLVVDKDGNPNVGIVIGYGASHAEAISTTTNNQYIINSFVNTPAFLVNFRFDHLKNKWFCNLIDTVHNIAADSIGFTASSTGSLVNEPEESRIQMSLTPDHSKIFYSWADFRGAKSMRNFSRDVFVRGFNPSTNMLTPEYSITSGTSFDKAGFLHAAPYTALRNASNDSTILPLTVAKLFVKSGTGNLLDSTCKFFYINGATFADADFTINSPKDSFSLPTASFTSTKITCNSFYFASTSTGANAYYWNFNPDVLSTPTPLNSTRATDTVSYKTAKKNITVWLRVTNADGIKEYALGYVSTSCGASGIESMDNTFGKISVFPNPTTGMLNVSISDFSDASKLSVSVENMLGQQVASMPTQTINNSAMMNFDLSNQPTGIYFIKFQTPEGIYTQKFVISK